MLGTLSRRTLAALTPLALVAAIAALGLSAPRCAADEVKGKYTIIDCPPGEGGTAERLAKLGDAALEMYVKDLGAQVPPQPFKVFLFATIGDYEKAEFERTKGAFKGNLAYTHRDTSDILMYMQPRPGRPATGDVGMLESLFTHELVHALCYRLYPSYDEFPNWLSEGMADSWSERAIAGGDSYCAEKSPWYSMFLLDVRMALEEGRYIPLDKLQGESLVGHDFAYRQLRYAECFSLVRWLDTPGQGKGEPERRAKFRDLLRAACSMQKGGNLQGAINAKFAETFGNLTTLERDFVRGVMIEPTFPWQIQLREVRAEPDGSILCETFPDNTALAFSTQPAVGPIESIMADVEVADLGRRQADLAFGFRGRDNFYLVGFAPGAIILMHFTGKWETVHTEKVDPAAFGAGKHTLRLDIDCSRLWAKVDGKSLMSVTLNEGTFPKGRWGVGAFDSRVIFRNASASNK